MLRRAIERAQPGEFDNRGVRLKAVGLLELIIYVDVDGGLLPHRQNRQRKLTESDFHAVRLSMAKLAKQQGCE